MLHHAVVCFLHENLRVCTTEARVVVREELANVGHREGAEDCIDDGVVHHIAIGMGDTAEFEVGSVRTVK
jgi:hypothetical protein